MSSTLTTNLQLFKATPGTSEPFRTADVNANWNAIDAVLLPPTVDVSAANVNNTTTETIIYTSPVGPARQGSAWELDLGGIFAHSATATTITIRVKLAGVTIGTWVINTPASALSAKPWRLNAKLFTLTTGGSGNWKFIGTGLATIGTTDTPASLASINAVNTAVPQNIDVTAQWGAANAANLFSCDAGITRRLTNA
jgi:hypothetical protein